MTTGGTKNVKTQTMMRRNKDRLGQATRGDGGLAMVRFVESYVDEGVEETTVSTIGAIERISAGQIMITYVRRRHGEMLVVAKHVYDYEEYLATCRALANLEQLLLNELRYGVQAGERAHLN